MRATDQRTLLLPCGQHKATPTGATHRARRNALTAYLRGLPGLDFSEKGLANLCQRFGITGDELAAAVAALQQPRPSQPTPDLLGIIGRAVGRACHQAAGGADPC